MEKEGPRVEIGITPVQSYLTNTLNEGCSVARWKFRNKRCGFSRKSQKVLQGQVGLAFLCSDSCSKREAREYGQRPPGYCCGKIGCLSPLLLPLAHQPSLDQC